MVNPGVINEDGTTADIIMEIGFSSDFVDGGHVLKRAELVEDVDADVADEGIIVTGYVHGQPSTLEVIGLGIFVEVEQSACGPNIISDIEYDIEI